MKADPRIATLPAIARELAQALGYDAGVQLMVKFGGTQMNVPKRPRKGSPVWQELGEAAARELSRLYGPGQIEVPTGSRLSRMQRNKRIQEHTGSHNQAARAFGVTRRWVRMVRRTAKTTPGPLFDRPSKRS